jgi:hypothetical protein
VYFGFTTTEFEEIKTAKRGTGKDLNHEATMFTWKILEIT